MARNGSSACVTQGPLGPDLHITQWLGRRNHRAAGRRRVAKPRAYPPNLVGRWCSICSPWHAGSYPGAYRLLGMLCDIGPEQARLYIQGRRPLPAHHALVLAEHVERFDGPSLARELRAYAAARQRTIAKHIPRRPGGNLADEDPAAAQETSRVSRLRKCAASAPIIFRIRGGRI